MRKNFFNVWTKHWSWLPREIVEPPSLEVYQNCPDTILCHGIEDEQGELVPCNLIHPGISFSTLWFCCLYRNVHYFITNGTLPPGCFTVDFIVLLFVASETFICETFICIYCILSQFSRLFSFLSSLPKPKNSKTCGNSIPPPNSLQS